MFLGADGAGAVTKCPGLAGAAEGGALPGSRKARDLAGSLEAGPLRGQLKDPGVRHEGARLLRSRRSKVLSAGKQHPDPASSRDRTGDWDWRGGCRPGPPGSWLAEASLPACSRVRRHVTELRSVRPGWIRPSARSECPGDPAPGPASLRPAPSCGASATWAGHRRQMPSPPRGRGN